MPSGSCQCGAISFEVEGALRDGDACHCTMCRKISGHYWASTNVPDSKLALSGAENITWYQSSEKIQRGFCATCGSALFWKPVDKDVIAIAMGAFDAPTRMKLECHIFVADKGDYYDIMDDIPQHQQG